MTGIPRFETGAYPHTDPLLAQPVAVPEARLEDPAFDAADRSQSTQDMSEIMPPSDTPGVNAPLSEVTVAAETDSFASISAERKAEIAAAVREATAYAIAAMESPPPPIPTRPLGLRIIPAGEEGAVSQADRFITAGREEYSPDPSRVVADTLDELQFAIIQTHTQAGWTAASRTREGLTLEEHVAQMAEHEAQHADWAAKLDVSGNFDPFYTVNIVPNIVTGGLGEHPAVILAGLETTRAGSALIGVVPVIPSQGDSLRMRARGYENVQEVVRAAYDQGLPIPSHLAKWINPSETPDVDRLAPRLLTTERRTPAQYHDAVQLAEAFAPREDAAYRRSTYFSSGMNLTVEPLGDQNFRVIAPRLEDRSVPPHVIPFAYEDELYSILATLQSYNVSAGESSIWDSTQDELANELQRGQIAVALGAEEGFFGITMYHEKGNLASKWSIDYIPTGLDTSGTGAALLHMGVRNPNRLNVAAMRAFGFNNVQELAQAARDQGLPRALFVDRWLTVDEHRTAATLLDTVSDPTEYYAVTQVIACAGLYAEEDEAGGLSGIAAFDMRQQGVSADSSDDAPVRIPRREDIVVPYDMVLVRTADELKKVFDAFAPTLGFNPDDQYDVAIVNDYLRRAAQRQETALAMGCTEGFFGFVLKKRPGANYIFEADYFPAGLETTKAGLAMLRLAVTNYEETDLPAVRALGYETPEQVARAAAEQGLPLPPALQRLL